jgi:iron complex outermembrane receptor protein
VNILDGRIPDHVGDKPVGGSFEARYGSNAGEGAGTLTLEGGAKQFAWRLDALDRSSGDFETPDGTLDNSDLDTEHGTAGASWAGERGYVGVAWGTFETNYGIPNPDEPVRIDMEQDRWDLTGAYTAPLGFLRGIKVRFGTTDYQHSEIEDSGEVGNTFFNDSWEARVELTHRQAGPFRGAFGFQVASRDFEAVGEEAFVPPTVTQNRAIFAVEEIGAGPVTFEVGARFEDQDNEVSDPLLPARSFDGLSASGGVVWRMPKDHALTFTAARSVRLPSAEELYAGGPHLATFQFVLGDPDLDGETGLGFDLSFRRTAGRVSGEVSLFTHDFSDYIFLSPTGTLIDIDPPNMEFLPEFQYIQTDATFRGAEAHLDIALLHRDPHHLALELGGDVVRAEEDGTGEPLPFITPVRYSAGVRYRGPRFWGFVEARRSAEQDRVAPFEMPTDGYTWINASVGWRFFAAATIHDVILRGLNLTDELSRNHVSPLKEIVPLPGRDLSLSYRLTF